MIDKIRHLLEVDFEALIEKMESTDSSEYGSMLDEFMREVGVCGCTDDAAIIVIIKCLMRSYLLYYDFLGSTDGRFGQVQELAKTLFVLTDSELYLALNILERNDLIEHGSNIQSSWLTQPGTELFVKYFDNYVCAVRDVIDCINMEQKDLVEKDSE